MSNLGAATEIEEVNGKAKMESAAASVPASEGTTKHKRKRKKLRINQEVANASDSRAVEPEATSIAAAGPASEAMPELKRKEETKAKEGKMAEQDATTKVVSVSEGTPKLKKKRKVAKAKEGEREEQEFTTKVVSGFNETPKHKGEVKERGMVEEGTSTFAVSALEGAPKCKKKVKVRGMAEHEGTTATVSASEGMPKLKRKKEMKAKEGKMAEQDATTKVVSASEGTPKLKKKKKEEAKAKEGEREEQEVTTKVVSAFDETPKQEEVKEREMVEEGTSTSAVSALEGAPKCKKEAKVWGMAEHEGTTAIVSGPKCKKEAKVWGMAEHEGTTAIVSALQGTQKCNKKEDKAKDREMAEQEATTTTISEGTIKCKKNKEKAKETVVGDLEPSASISASKGTPKRKKLKKKNMMKEQQESSQALSGPGLVDKIVADKPGNSFTNAEGPSLGADVSMDPINGEDPNCSEAKDANDRVKCEAGEGITKCSENFSSLQESSEERKTRISRAKRKRKQDASSRGPCISPQDVSSLDSSMDHDCSCIYDSCFVQARKQKFTNIYSPRGSLIRFKRKKLLILDLNGLLGDINMDYQNAHKAHGKVKNKLVFKRPYCDDFLEFCFENFEVGIWSSRLKDNVNAVINILMPKLKQHLLFCWDMSMCTTTGCNTLEKSFKPLVLKELKKLWNKEDPDLPWEQGEFSPSNTLLVDDSPYKAVCNPPHTAIFPQPYCYLNQRDDHSLGPSGDLRVYLERLSSADDIQVFVQDNPFGQPSITESDPNWKFYVKIVDEVERVREALG